MSRKDDIKRLILEGKSEEAVQRLSMEENEQDPEWNYLMGCVYYYIHSIPSQRTEGLKKASLYFEKAAALGDSEAAIYHRWCQEDIALLVQRSRMLVGPEETNKDLKAINQKITPFVWTTFDGGVSVRLDCKKFVMDFFVSRSEEGFEGNGYDWASFAWTFLKEEKPNLIDQIKLDPSTEQFVAVSENAAAMKEFIDAFKVVYDDPKKTEALFLLTEADVYGAGAH